MLHGRGASGDDLIGLADVFAESFPNAVFYSPNAPNPLDPGGLAYQWYDLDGTDRSKAVLGPEPLVNEFIDERLAEYGLDAARCLLIGFSQGSIMSLHLAPRRATQLAGVVAFSGMMVTGDSLAKERVSSPPFVLIHGSEDQVLRSRESEYAGKMLGEADVPVTVHILSGLAHGIDRRGIDIATDFMKQVLG
jgi:phospholipase/carboxylesterase